MGGSTGLREAREQKRARENHDGAEGGLESLMGPERGLKSLLDHPSSSTRAHETPFAPPPTRPLESATRGLSGAARPPHETAFQEQLRRRAADPEKFSELIRGIYGDDVPQERIDALQQKVAREDWSWLPRSSQVEPGRLTDANTGRAADGAYVASSQAILLNSELAPAEKTRVYAEEVGHHLDQMLKGDKDTQGDEGELFARELFGERLTPTQRDAIRAENDAHRLRIGSTTVDAEFATPSTEQAAMPSGAAAITEGDAPKVTGATVLDAPYDGNFENFTPEQLAAADAALREQGYVFIGYRGVPPGEAARDVNAGITPREGVEGGGPWEGMYLSDNPEVAAGYTGHPETGFARGGQLVRVYVPRELADRIQSTDTPLDSPEGLAEFEAHRAGAGEAWGFRGPESSDLSRPETILSWEAAGDAVFIPSTVRVSQDYAGRVLANPEADQPISETPFPALEDIGAASGGAELAREAAASYENFATKLAEGDLDGAVESLRLADQRRVEARNVLGAAEVTALDAQAQAAHASLLEAGEAAQLRTSTLVQEAAELQAAGPGDAATYSAVSEKFAAARTSWRDAHMALGYLESAEAAEPGLLAPLGGRIDGLQSGIAAVNESYVGMLENMVGEAEQALTRASAAIEATGGAAPSAANARQYGEALEISARVRSLQHELGRHALSGPEGTRATFEALEGRLDRGLSALDAVAEAHGIDFADPAMLAETRATGGAGFEDLVGGAEGLRAGLRIAGKAMLILGVAADGYRLYQSEDKGRTGVESRIISPSVSHACS